MVRLTGLEPATLGLGNHSSLIPVRREKNGFPLIIKVFRLSSFSLDLAGLSKFCCALVTWGRVWLYATFDSALLLVRRFCQAEKEIFIMGILTNS
jgi:hypothetical protein